MVFFPTISSLICHMNRRVTNMTISFSNAYGEPLFTLQRMVTDNHMHLFMLMLIQLRNLERGHRRKHT